MVVKPMSLCKDLIPERFGITALFFKYYLTMNCNIMKVF